MTENGKSCENCKFWKKSDIIPEDFPYWGVCQKMTADCFIPLHKDTLAFAFETGESPSMTMTSQKFCCNMHEEKS